jgi:hypothetical protein
LKNSTAKIIDTRPVLALLGGPKRYERFVLGGMSEDHNEDYYSVEDQRFLGEEGFGEEISRPVGEKEPRKKRRPIEADLKEIARQSETTVELVRGRDRRWEV